VQREVCEVYTASPLGAPRARDIWVAWALLLLSLPEPDHAELPSATSVTDISLPK
jgi:hypothetical protein